MSHTPTPWERLDAALFLIAALLLACNGYLISMAILLGSYLISIRLRAIEAALAAAKGE